MNNLKKKGFTLIEIAIIIVIIGILALLASKNFGGHVTKAQLHRIYNDTQVAKDIMDGELRLHSKDIHNRVLECPYKAKILEQFKEETDDEEITIQDNDFLEKYIKQNKVFNSKERITDMTMIDSDPYYLMKDKLIDAKSTTELDGSFLTTLQGEVLYVNEKLTGYPIDCKKIDKDIFRYTEYDIVFEPTSPYSPISRDIYENYPFKEYWDMKENHPDKNIDNYYDDSVVFINANHNKVSEFYKNGNPSKLMIGGNQVDISRTTIGHDYTSIHPSYRKGDSYKNDTLSKHGPAGKSGSGRIYRGHPLAILQMDKVKKHKNLYNKYLVEMYKLSIPPEQLKELNELANIEFNPGHYAVQLKTKLTDENSVGVKNSILQSEFTEDKNSSNASGDLKYLYELYNSCKISGDFNPYYKAILENNNNAYGLGEEETGFEKQSIPMAYFKTQSQETHDNDDRTLQVLNTVDITNHKEKDVRQLTTTSGNLVPQPKHYEGMTCVGGFIKRDGKHIGKWINDGSSIPLLLDLENDQQEIYYIYCPKENAENFKENKFPNLDKHFDK